MGAFAALGHVAQGFNEAHQTDLQRQFESEQSMRQQAIGHLSKLAGDETALPEARTAATQGILQITQTPMGKLNQQTVGKILSGVIVPGRPSQQIAQFTPPPQPPMNLGGTELPGLTPPPVSLMSPPRPPGSFYTHEELAQQAAQKAGAVTSATAGATMATPLYRRNPDNSFTAIPISHAGTEMGAGVSGVVPPGALAPSNLRSIVIKGPDGTPVPAYEDRMGVRGVPGAIYDQSGQLVPNAEIFNSALVPKSSTQSMGASGAITTTHTATPQGKGTADKQTSALGAPPAPPSGVIGALPTGESTAQPAAAAQPKVKPPATPKPMNHLTKGAVDWSNATDPVSLAAVAWGTKGIKPSGGAMAERQVLSRMKQMGLSPSLPIPPALQLKVQEGFAARNSAVGLIDDILKNSRVLDSMISAGKIAIGASPDGSGVLTRLADLSDQEAKVAGDFSQLIEHVNLLRGPLGATGFRGKEAWGALQAQRGKIMSDPRITRQQLSGMRDRLLSLNNADKMVMEGQGTNTAGASGPPAPPAGTATAPGGGFNWDAHPVFTPEKK
jgi:hypothetical protein